VCLSGIDRILVIMARSKTPSARKRQTPVKPATTGGKDPVKHERAEPKPPLLVALTTYLGYVVLIVFGHVRDFFGKLFKMGRYYGKGSSDEVDVRRAPLVNGWENFYTRRMYHRIQDVWNRPITGPPGGRIALLDRESKDGNVTFDVKKTTKEVINLGSYNYLGFADDWQETCRDSVVETFEDYGVSTCSARMDIGTTALHKELEQLVAQFLNKEDAIVFNMGYGTNSATIPALIGKGGLIVSDGLNHTSIVNGARASGAKIKVFKHDSPQHLEKVLQNAIAEGQPRTHLPWKKILVMVEGIYSMEGEISNLPAIVKVAKKYKAYIYVDEAHSIGALGPTGRGVCEHHNVDTADIDILMGTFTKSFGAMGGYICGTREFVDYIRTHADGSMYSNSMSPVCCKQILRSFKVIMGLDGTTIGREKLDSLKDNANYFRDGLTKIGLQVLGDYDSPVMPILLYNPTKIAAFSRECLARGLAVVSVGYPATPLIESRARFCISAGHTRKDMDEALVVIKEVADKLRLRYETHMLG
jgi:serine palmitoyltransferase